MKPASTSPDPAVASHGDPLALTHARPSGWAITVSAPLSRTTASAVFAARRTAVIRSGLAFNTPGKSRSNSPKCGVKTSSTSRAENNSSGSSRKTVMASASMTNAAPVRASARVFSKVDSLTPAAGPITTASASAQANSSSNSVPKGRSITASKCAALIGRASGGDRIVTKPAPIRKPARAANRAAPVFHASPLTTTIRPRACLCDIAVGQGNWLSQASGEFSIN